ATACEPGLTSAPNFWFLWSPSFRHKIDFNSAAGAKAMRAKRERRRIFPDVRFSPTPVAGRLERLDAAAEAPQLARHRILVHDALADATMQLRLRREEGGAGGLLIAAGDRCLDLFDEGPDARDARLVDRGPPLSLTDPLLGGFVVGHCRLS